jgi:hypothetical protein
MIDKATAISSLRPNTEWTMTNEDVKSIEWNTPNVKPLTEKEVADEMARLQKNIDDAKSHLLLKLGITAEEAAILLS